jgi:uncharacterized protein YggE
VYKPLLLAAALLAQLSPPPSGPIRAPMGVQPNGPEDGISVTGSGTATAQAQTAQVTLHISSRGNALVIDSAALQPIVDALVGIGIDRSAISLPPYLVGDAKVNNVSITANVDRPSPTMIQQGMLSLAGAFAKTPQLLLNNAEVRVSADNCADLMRRAEADAIADARKNAQFIASQLGVHAGNVLAVQEYGGVNPGMPNACSSMYFFGPYGPSQPMQSPGDMLTVKVMRSVGMRFAIKH